MKKILLLSFFFIGISKLYAQPYFFSQSNEPYTNLSGITSINSGSVWSGFQTFTIPIGFTFNFMGSNFSSVTLEATGRLIFDANHFYYADMFVVSGMRDKGISSSLSPLTYQLTGSIGNQILKIEINNATYQNDLSSTINYQIWLYENSSIIELHMGPNSIVNPVNAFSSGGPFSGVFNVTSFSPITYGYGLAIFNSSTSPSDSTFTGIGISTAGITLTNAPTDSTIYRFSTDSISTSVDNVTNQSNFIIFPNPCSGLITIKKPIGLNGDVYFKLFDATSRLILEKNIPVESHVTKIDIKNNRAGLYHLHIIVDDKIFVEKILKY